jgi:hypothetical protein
MSAKALTQQPYWFGRFHSNSIATTQEFADYSDFDDACTAIPKPHELRPLACVFHARTMVH